MNILDAIILICMIPAVILGIKKGFIAQVISIIAIIAGVWASARFANLLGDWLSTYISASEQTLKLTAFAIILVVVIIGLLLLGKAMEAIIKLVALGWVNKLLGVIFSLLKCILILGILALIFEAINDAFGLVSQEYIAQSSLYEGVKWIADHIFPYVKNMLNIN